MADANLSRIAGEDLQWVSPLAKLALSGVDLFTVSKLLAGIRTFKMTQRYAHLSPDHKRRATERLNGYFEGQVEERVVPRPVAVDGPR